jgi:hypothetical protein
MGALLTLVLSSSSPALLPLWELVDQERYSEATAAALILARTGDRPESLRRQALEIAFTAACMGRTGRCTAQATQLVDWAPAWRPDSRMNPDLLKRLRAARLTQAKRWGELPRGRLDAGRWCADSDAVELLVLIRGATGDTFVRQPNRCVALEPGTRGYILALDAQLRGVAALGTPVTDTLLRPERATIDRTKWIVGASIGAVAVLTGLIIYAAQTPGYGTLKATVSTP